MNSEYLSIETKYVIELLKSGITTSYDVKFPEEADSLTVSRIIQSNGILATVYPLLENSSFPQTKFIASRLSKKFYASLRQSLLFDAEGKQIEKTFDVDSIDYIMLKGWVLRNLYPNATMRSMSDIDILIKDYDYKKLKLTMGRLGFEAWPETSWMHDIFKKETVEVETHKRLTDDSGYVQQWEKQIWSRAIKIPNTSHGWKMSDEDFYIYHLLHLYKDFKYGYLILRRIADTWLFINRFSNLDEEYLNKELSNMGLVLFRSRIEQLARVCFDDVIADDNSVVLIKHAVNTCKYVKGKAYKTARIVTMSGKSRSLGSGKRHSFIYAIFMPFGRMKVHFPKLEKYPVLLPYYWLVRIFQHIGKLSFYSNKLNYKNISENDYQEMKAFLIAGGVLSE